MNIWTNGCFDILHTGHIDLLWYAKNFVNPNAESNENFRIYDDNILFVGLDSDERVRKAKGNDRPINDIETRVKIISNLKMVDKVVVFDSDDELRDYIKKLNIDYMIVGDQYKNKEVIGYENAKIGVAYYPVNDKSTTNIIEKIRDSNILAVIPEITYDNQIIKLSAFPYDVLTNNIMFGENNYNPNFHEINLLEFIKKRFKGGVALDIGANIGNHSIFFSKFVFDKTYAFEPNPKSFTILEKNKRDNNISDDKLVINCVALSDGNYNYMLTDFKGNTGGCKVIEGQGDGNFFTYKLDDIDFPEKISLIKIDVEGHELKVLKGAIKLINRDFPDIAVECFSDTDSDFKIINPYMESINYRLIESFYKNFVYYYEYKFKIKI